MYMTIRPKRATSICAAPMNDANTKKRIKRILYEREQIVRRVGALAAEIRNDYADRSLSVVVLANGALFFAAELLLQLEMDVELDILSVSSYSGAERGELIIERSNDLKIDLRDRHVLVLDDIFESGNTLKHVFDHLNEAAPRDLKSCVLLLKECEREHDELPDYFGFNVEDEFVVGYGLDFDERYRNLPYIGILDEI